MPAASNKNNGQFNTDQPLNAFRIVAEFPAGVIRSNLELEKLGDILGITFLKGSRRFCKKALAETLSGLQIIAVPLVLL